MFLPICSNLLIYDASYPHSLWLAICQSTNWFYWPFTLFLIVLSQVQVRCNVKLTIHCYVGFSLACTTLALGLSYKTLSSCSLRHLGVSRHLNRVPRLISVFSIKTSFEPLPQCEKSRRVTRAPHWYLPLSCFFTLIPSVTKSWHSFMFLTSISLHFAFFARHPSCETFLWTSTLPHYLSSHCAVPALSTGLNSIHLSISPFWRTIFFHVIG